VRKLITRIALLLLFVAAAAAEKPPNTDKLINQAKVRAQAEHKSILVIFGASWCSGCDDLEHFLAAPEVREIFDRYFTIVHLNVFEQAGEHPGNNTPESEKWIIKFGGVTRSGEVSLPFLVVLNSEGKPVSDSRLNAKGQQPKNVGLPETPEEIAWFLKMLATGAPSITPDETAWIEDVLKRAAS
jgi:thioredoxin-related protein